MDIIEAIYDFQLVYMRFHHEKPENAVLFKQQLEDLVVCGSKFLRAAGVDLGMEERKDLDISLKYINHILTDFRTKTDREWTGEELAKIKSLVIRFFEDVFDSPTLKPVFGYSANAS